MNIILLLELEDHDIDGLEDYKDKSDPVRGHDSIWCITCVSVKAVSEVIPKDTGIATSPTDREITDYVAEVINETRNRKR